MKGPGPSGRPACTLGCLLCALGLSRWEALSPGRKGCASQGVVGQLLSPEPLFYKFLIRTQNWDASCPCPQGSVGTVSLQNMGAALVGSQEDSDSRGLSFPKMGTCQKVFM